MAFTLKDAKNTLSGLTKTARFFFSDYAKLLGEPVAQFGRMATDPMYRRAIFNPNSFNVNDAAKLQKYGSGNILLSPEQMANRGQIVKTGAMATGKALAGTALLAKGGPAMLTKQGMMGTGIMGGIGGVANKLQGGSFIEGAATGIGSAPFIQGFSGYSNPIIGKILTKTPIAQLSPTGAGFASEVGRRAIQGTANVVEGLGMDKTMGMQTTAGSIGLDFGMGALFPQFGGRVKGSNFSLDKGTYNEMVKAEDMIRNPEKYLGEMDLGKHNTPAGLKEAKETAIKAIKQRGAETIDFIAGRYLPDKQLATVKTVEDKIKALTDLHYENKLANVEGSFLADSKKTPSVNNQTKVPSVSQPEVKTEVLSPQSQLSDMSKSSRQPLGQGSRSSPELSDVGSKSSFETIIPHGKKERGVMRNIRTSEATSPELVKTVEDITGKSRYYTPYSDKKSLKNARSLIATEGMDNAKKTVLDGEYNKTNVATAEVLVSKAMKEGRLDEAEEILKVMAEKATIAGQANQAWSMWSRFTPEGMVTFATKTVLNAKEKMGMATKLLRQVVGKSNDLQITKADADKISDLMVKANKAADEATKMKYTKQAVEIINSKIPYGVSELFDMYRYNNMLSNPMTHMRNLTSTALNTIVTRPLVLAGKGDFAGVVKYYKGIKDGMGGAIDAFNKARKGDVPIEKPDLRGIRIEKAPKIFTGATRYMEAADRFFQELIKSGETSRGASPEEAAKIAREFVFRDIIDPKNKSGQGVVLSSIDRATGAFIDLGRKVPLVRWFIPFIQTPMNVLKIGMEFTPGVGMTTLWKNTKKSDQLSKQLIGSTVFAMAGYAALNDKTTWASPTDPTHKETFYSSGRKPYSVLVGDKWVPMHTFGVFAYPMALAAAMKYYTEDQPEALTKTQSDKIIDILSSQLQFFSQQSFVAGLGSFVDAIRREPDASGAASMAFTAGQAIPFSGLVSYIARVVDPVFRKVDAESNVGKFAQGIQRQIPFASRSLEAYTTSTGEPSKRNLTDYGLGGPFGVAPFGQGQRDAEMDAGYSNRTTQLQYNRVVTRAENIKDQAKALYEQGKTDEFNALIDKNIDVLRQGMMADKIVEKVRKYQGYRKKVIESPLSSKEKRELIVLIDEQIKTLLDETNSLVK
jgi:hypothetical protein